MPYGIKGETPTQTKWMEGCVSSIKGTNKRTGKPYTESDKIAICKAQLRKQGWKTSEDATSEESLRDLEDKIYRALEPFRTDTVQPSMPSISVSDVFQDFVILRVSDDLYRVSWVEDASGDIKFDFASKVKVQKVITYEPIVEEHVQSSRREAFYGGKKVIVYD